MIRALLKRDLNVALKKQGVEIENVDISRTANDKFGDFSTNVALKFAHNIKQSPMDFANTLSDSLGDLPHVKKLEVKEPGFINFFIKDDFWQDQVSDVLKEGRRYGSSTVNVGKKARVEFVSANPTGPLHFGNARGGPIGDVLGSVLEFSGYKVMREYYHNDVGEQVRKLGDSIVSVARGEKLEDQEYKGEYVLDLANKVKNSKLNQSPDEVGVKAVEILLDGILKDCEEMGIKFDKVFKESELIGSGQTKEDLDHLREKGSLKEKDGALWFAPNDEFLRDRETVVVKSDGTFTYFANDIAYHELKFKDKPDLVVDVFGANHHGHVPRLQAVISALGYDERKFFVILYQWVRFKKGSKVLKMSKRSGTFITVSEVLSEIGKDAARFFILMHDHNSPIDFDLDLAREKSNKNPVYYVQYANARIAQILSKLKVKSEKSKVNELNLHLLKSEYELKLIKQITKLPEIVEDISEDFAVHHLTAYAIDLADSIHKFYENCHVVGAQEELQHSRVYLLCAAQISLKNTLNLLGVSAPDRM